jgi:hypothetical protein
LSLHFAQQENSMAIYHDSTYFSHSSEEAFNQLYEAGETPRYSGIYRCTGCGRETVAEAAGPLPETNSHKHSAMQGPMKWRLIVYPRLTP